MRRTWCAVILVGLVFSGCGVAGARQPTLREPPPPPAQIHPDWPGCLAIGAFGAPSESPPEAGQGSIPAEFHPTTAVRCAFGESGHTVHDGLERRAVDPAELADLITYLRRPSETVPLPEQQACAAMAWLPPWLFLLDADGRWIRPQVPTDACGFPLDLWADGSMLLPYDILTSTNTLVCRMAGDPPVCRPW